MSEFYEIPRPLHIKSINTAFHFTYEKNYYFSGESHDFWELVFISSGEAVIAKNNRVFNLGTGDIAFHPPMEFHRVWSEGKQFKLLVISFSAENDEVLKRLGEGIFSLNLSQQHTLKSLVEEIYDTFTVDDIMLSSNGETPLSLQSTVTKLELFLLELLNWGDYEKKRDKSLPARQFSQIIKSMNDNIEQNLSVEELAQLSALSVSNLKRICHKYTGVGPAKHFLTLKMLRAMQLLKSGMNVTEVSHQLGFSSQSYFSSTFKRETGKSPKDYKNEV